MISAPILSKLNYDKDPRYYESFVRAIEILNKGLADKEIWNVELNNAKFTLSNAVDRALSITCDRHRSARTGDYVYEKWHDDFSGYCSFNQAAGRIKRLTKNAPKTKVVQDYIEALKEVDVLWKAICELKPLIKKGRRPNQNKTEAQIAADLKNTGVCAICGNRQKLDADKVVHHGYRMSEYNHAGVRLGSCFGVGYMPYELSNEANVAFAPHLETERKGLEAALAEYKSGTITEFEIEESEWNPKTRRSEVRKMTVFKTGSGFGKFEKELKHRIFQCESGLRMVNFHIEINDAKIKGWKLEPLLYGR
jgi:hypothetical protein